MYITLNFADRNAFFRSGFLHWAMLVSDGHPTSLTGSRSDYGKLYSSGRSSFPRYLSWQTSKEIFSIPLTRTLFLVPCDSHHAVPIIDMHALIIVNRRSMGLNVAQWQWKISHSIQLTLGT
jgi:hypothetical protein